MTEPKIMSGRKLIIITTLSLAGGIIGTVVGRAFSAALQTTPAWVSSAILVGTIAFIIVGLLLLPTAIRLARNKDGSSAV